MFETYSPPETFSDGQQIRMPQRRTRHRVWILYDPAIPIDHPERYEISQLEIAAEREGVEVRVVDPRRVTLTPGCSSGVCVEDQYVPRPDVVINRSGALTSDQTLHLLRSLAKQGVACRNNAVSIEISRDKLLTAQTLIGHVPHPETLPLTPETDLDRVRDLLGDLVIVKPARGTQGSGVELLDRCGLKSFHNRLSTFGANPTMLVQRYVQSSHGRDIRVLVLAGRAMAAMQRQSCDGSVTANASKGGQVTRLDMTSEMADIATKTCRRLHLHSAGVDLLHTPDGFTVCEANSSPGFKALQKCHPALDIAREMLQSVLAPSPDLALS